MKTPPKVLLAMGTRPEIIKMAPVYFALRQQGLTPRLLHTGQHTDMAETLYDLFGITPDFQLDLRREALPATNDNEPPSHCALSLLGSALLQKVAHVLSQEEFSAVLVHGDTSSAFMAALAAFYKKLPIGHVEAGLRSHHEYNPFPEEKNRVLIGQLARWHFAPTEKACRNLLAEGITGQQVHVVGNTIVEAAEMGAQKLGDYRLRHPQDCALVEALAPQLAQKKMVVVTMHRRENHGAQVRMVAQAVVELLRQHEDMLVVWPVHPNPVVKSAVHQVLCDLPQGMAERLHVCEPLNYPVLLWVLKHAWLALTDSGGIQEEAVAVKTPVLVLRDTTERPEVIETGAGLLVGTEKRNIVMQVNRLYYDAAQHASMCSATNPFGDGTTARRICEILKHDLLSSQPSSAQFGVA